MALGQVVRKTAVSECLPLGCRWHLAATPGRTHRPRPIVLSRSEVPKIPGKLHATSRGHTAVTAASCACLAKR